MKRSTGVTVSAILVFLGSGLTLVFGALMAFAFFFMPRTPAQPPFVRNILAFSIFLYAAFAVWGMASGVGLLLLRQWARISMIVFCSILLFFAVPALVIVPFLPMPPTPGAPSNFALIFKVGMSVFYGIFAAIGGAWIYFFNRRSVKDQFRSPAEEFDLITPGAQRAKRPLSITVIAWILLVSGCLALPILLLRSPMLFMGSMLTGWWSTLCMLTWCVVQVAAGIGLLRLRSWGRTLSVGLFSFMLVNCAATVLLPGREARFEQVYAKAQADMQARMGLPATGMPSVGMSPMLSAEFTHFFMWFGVIFGIVFALVQMWFVVTRKDAFSSVTEVSALSS